MQEELEVQGTGSTTKLPLCWTLSCEWLSFPLKTSWGAPPLQLPLRKKVLGLLGLLLSLEAWTCFVSDATCSTVWCSTQHHLLISLIFAYTIINSPPPIKLSSLTMLQGGGEETWGSEPWMRQPPKEEPAWQWSLSCETADTQKKGQQDRKRLCLMVLRDSSTGQCFQLGWEAPVNFVHGVL